MPEAPSESEVIDALEFFQDALFKIAEYKLPDPARYARLRAEVLLIEGLAPRLPRYVREFETPDDVWNYIKRFHHTWEGRRTRIKESLQPAFDWARQGKAQHVDLRGGFSGDVKRLVVTEPPASGSERKVVVFGPDDAVGILRLRQIQSELTRLGFPSHLIRELPDIPDQSIEQKARLWALRAPFTIMEDSIAGGHLVEYEYCKQMSVTTVVLREKGKGSTWMIKETDSLDHPFIRFIYYDPGDVSAAVTEGAKWATEVSKRRESMFREHEPWRGSK